MLLYSFQKIFGCTCYRGDKVIDIYEAIKEKQVVRNFIVFVGEGVDWESSVTELEALHARDIPPKFVIIPNSDIPGIDEHGEDGHHDIYGALFHHFELTAAQKKLWEEGLVGDKDYVDPAQLLKAELDSKHGIDPFKVFAMSYSPHEGCDCLEEEDADGGFTDCIGQFLAQLFTLGKRVRAAV